MRIYAAKPIFIIDIDVEVMGGCFYYELFFKKVYFKIGWESGIVLILALPV